MQKGIVSQGQQGLNALAALAAKIKANEELKRDYIADSRETVMSVVPAQANERAQVVLGVPEPSGLLRAMPLQALAHRQLGGRLGVHATYYDRMLAEAPELLARNVNHWLQAKPERRMVRTLDGNVRAYLSDRYQRIDNEEVASVVIPILAGLPEVSIVSCEITEHRMYIQATTPSVWGQVRVGDEVQAGVAISNSEVGSGAVSVAALAWRKRCENGAMSVDKFRAFHVGRQVDDTEQLWRDDTRKSDDRTVLLKVRDMVAAAVDAVRFRERLAKMQGLAGTALTGTVVRAVEVLARKVGVTQQEQAGILDALIKGGDLTAWGLVNAVTAQAHTAASYDRAVEFEAIGGALIEASPSDWRQVLEAA